MNGKRFREAGHSTENALNENTVFGETAICPMVLEVPPTDSTGKKKCFPAPWIHDHRHLDIENGKFNLVTNPGNGKPPSLQPTRLSDSNENSKPHVVFFIVDDVAIILDYVISVTEYNNTYTQID
jgi:hypothetical protein